MTAKILLETLAGVLAGRPIITRKDLARHYGRSLRTIDRWRAGKRLPRPVYINGPMWKPEQIADMEQNHR